MSRLNEVDFFILFGIILNLTAGDGISEVTKAFNQYKLVPDILQSPPNAFLKVTYEENTNVFLGNTLTPIQVKSQPLVKWRTAVGSFYTLTMINSDSPSGSITNWLVSNIPGNKVEKGKVIVPYMGPGSESNTELHRYVFLLYRQQGEIIFEENYSPSSITEGRQNFNTTAFALKYRLGEPIAGNFFLSN